MSFIRGVKAAFREIHVCNLHTRSATRWYNWVTMTVYYLLHVAEAVLFFASLTTLSANWAALWLFDRE